MNIKRIKLAMASLLLIIFAVTPEPVLYAQQEDSPLNHIHEQMQVLDQNYSQQKLFLHLDKTEYLAGDNIWLKAYLVDANTLVPDMRSTNLYIELTNYEGKLADVMLLRLNSGFAHGHISLPDSVPEGSYRIKAYTDWMMNFHEDFFYSQDLHVINPIEENFLRRRDIWQNRLYNRSLSGKQEKVQFAFFPEGGDLIAGIENRVAFKAANSLGKGLAASGTLYDDDGTEILEFSTYHNGMGDFSLVPEYNKRYKAEITFDNGETKRVRLPRSIERGYALSAKLDHDAAHIKVQSNHQNLSNELILLVQTRGEIQYLQQNELQDKELTVEIPLNHLKTGISQVKLFDISGKPVSERLLFVNKGDFESTDLAEAKETTNARDRTEIELTLGLTGDYAEEGSYSLAIIDAESETASYPPNIASELLFFGDLSIPVEDPAFYLTYDSQEAIKAADLLMMTKGWRRFDWREILDGEFPEITYGFPQGITIAGEISPRSSSRPVGEVKVELAAHAYDGKVDVYETKTDSKGSFIFPDLDYKGEFTAMIRANESYGRRSLQVELDTRGFDHVEYEPSFNTRLLTTTSRGDNWERVPQPEPMLEKQELFEPSRQRRSKFGPPNQVIHFDDIRTEHNNIISVLRARVRGLRVVGNEIILRGQTSFYHSNQPLFMIDEQIVDRNAFLNVSMGEVDRLEVITGADAMLGSRGSGGALILYTLTGDSRFHGSYEFSMIGYHIPAETFESRIEAGKHKQHNIDRTLHWEPAMSANEHGEIITSFSIDAYVRNVRVILQGIDSRGNITFSDHFIEL